MPINMRADRAVLKRQQQEKIHEGLLSSQLEQFKVKQISLWENKMLGVVRKGRIKNKVSDMQRQHAANLQERRRMLAEKLSAEQKAYEAEMIAQEETPTQRMERMANRAFELKKRREDERKAFVQEKLYQQWRAGIDDLRTLDTKIVQLKTVADRDLQLNDKAMREAEEKAHEDFYARLWHEGYVAKIEREQREKEIKHDRTEQAKATLAVQIQMKDSRVATEKRELDLEAETMKRLWLEEEAKDRQETISHKIQAKEDRKKSDEYAAIQQAAKAEVSRRLLQEDKDFVNSVLEKERLVAEMEEGEKEKAKKKAIEFTEALKIEMARKAESEENLIRLQHEESERQWAKRYAQWEKEELARRSLMEEVYHDRAEQVRLKQHLREKVKADRDLEHDLVQAELINLEQVEREREVGERTVAQRHQEELFRQMDFHQVQRHRQLQQHAIEQRQAAIAEEKIRRACEVEKTKANHIMQEVQGKRQAQRTQVTAPWDRT